MRGGVHYGIAGGVLILVIAAAAALHWTALDGPAWPLDDAYIVLHNARALLHGDPSFPGAPALYGATSLLHSLTLAALSAAAPPQTALWALSWAAIAAAGLGVLAAGRTFGLPAGWSLALAVAVLTSGSAVYVLLNGLETGWMIAATIWTLVLFARDRASPAGAVLCGLLPFVRPELGLISTVLMLGMLLDAWRDRRAEALRALALCLGPALTLLAAQWALTGAPLPRTGFAKRAFFADPDLGAGTLALYFLAKLAAFAVGAGGLVAALFLPRGTLPRRASLAALGLTAAMGALYPAVSAQNGMRLLYVLMPLAAFNLAALAGDAAPGARRVGRALIAAALALNLHALSYKAPADVARIADKRATLETVGAWIEANLDPDAPLMLHDVGYAAWATDVPLVDMVGLKSPASHAVHARLTALRGASAMPEAVDEIARMSGARAIMVSAEWDDRFGFIAGLRARGWTAELLSDDALRGYAVYRLTPPR